MIFLSEWKECTIADLGEVVGGATPSTKKTENYENGDISWITPKDLSTFNGRFITRGERSITEIGLNSCSTRLLPPNSVLFSSRAPIGYVAIAAKEMCTNQGFKSVIPNSDTDYMFLYYLLKFNKGNIENMGSGTTFKEVSGNTMKSIKVYIPVDIEEQRKIASILSALDDKIELNNRINENLESQAQAIFKSWFVDFEPFGGVKPEEWTEKSVYDLAEYINGAAFKKNEYSTEGIPIIKIAELKNGITNSTQYCCIEKDEKYYFDNKAILFSWSGNPETSIDTFLWYRGKAILNQHTFRVVSKYNAPAFTYFLLKYLKPKFTHIASNKQTTGLGHVTVSDLKRLQFSCSTDAIEEFEKMSKPLFDMIYNTYVESNRLSKLRDVLLPKLMNGEIDVSEVKI